MKRLLVVVLVVLLVGVFSAFAVDIPSPFDEIKKMAMAGTPNEDGDYILKMESYILSYLPSYHMVGIGRNDFGIIFYHEDEKAFTTPSMCCQCLLPREIAIEKAKELFEEYKELAIKKT